MTVTIVPERRGNVTAAYRAKAGDRETVGPTAGAALDALNEQLSPSEAGTLVVIQQFQPDQFFTAAQLARLTELLSLRRTAESLGHELSIDQQQELERLIETEFEASGKRIEALAAELHP